MSAQDNKIPRVSHLNIRNSPYYRIAKEISGQREREHKLRAQGKQTKHAIVKQNKMI